MSAPLPNCAVPQTSPTAETAAAAAANGKLARLSKHSLKEGWDRAAVAKFCAAYEASGKKLPPGEPPDLAQKLDKVCSDKSLKP